LQGKASKWQSKHGGHSSWQFSSPLLTRSAVDRVVGKYTALGRISELIKASFSSADGEAASTAPKKTVYNSTTYNECDFTEVRRRENPLIILQ